MFNEGTRVTINEGEGKGSHGIITSSNVVDNETMYSVLLDGEHEDRWYLENHLTKEE